LPGCPGSPKRRPTGHEGLGRGWVKKTVRWRSLKGVQKSNQERKFPRKKPPMFRGQKKSEPGPPDESIYRTERRDSEEKEATNCKLRKKGPSLVSESCVKESLRRQR